jgi:hypothetical protein
MELVLSGPSSSLLVVLSLAPILRATPICLMRLVRVKSGRDAVSESVDQTRTESLQPF